MKTVDYENEILQVTLPFSTTDASMILKTETYDDQTFISSWSANKLHAIIRLLKHIDHNGRVLVFGDGKYDYPMLRYFDGNLVTPEFKWSNNHDRNSL